MAQGASVTQASKPQALCPVCGASVRVRRDGCLREHQRPYGLRWRVRCEGSGVVVTLAGGAA